MNAYMNIPKDAVPTTIRSRTSLVTAADIPSAIRLNATPVNQKYFITLAAAGLITLQIMRSVPRISIRSTSRSMTSGIVMKG